MSQIYDCGQQWFYTMRIQGGADGKGAVPKVIALRGDDCDLGGSKHEGASCYGCVSTYESW